MCGISGVYRPKDLEDEDIYYSKLSLTNLRSRGPDCSRSMRLNNKLIFNHTRLSIIAPEAKYHQPLVSFSGRFTIVFNGEIYNYKELKNNLIKASNDNQYLNFINDINSDTGILLEHFEAFGIEETLVLLNGMYALAVFDRNSEFLYLARDYYGQKPLFYSNESNLLTFSSLLTDCRNLSRIKTKFNTLNAQHGFQFGMSLFPETLICGIFELPPGHLMTVCIHDHYSIVKSFIDLRDKIKNNFVNNSESKDFSEIFELVMKRHLIADCDISLLLSGGVDSSLIASYLKDNLLEKNINTYTLDFPDSNDSKLSCLVSSQLNLKHNLIPLEQKEFSEIVEKTLIEIDQPAYDPAIFSARYLNKKSKETNCKVIITGDGADEIFGGYRRHFKSFFHIPYLPPSLSKIISNYFHIINQNINIHRKFNQLIHLLLSNSAAESYLNSLSDNPQIYKYSDYIQLLLQEFYTQQSSSLLHSKIDEKFFLPNKMLFKSDRASMLESLEARSPYLDLEFLPISNRVDKLIPKKILKADLKRRIKNYPIKNKKEGFKTNFKYLENFLNKQGFSSKLADINEIIGFHSYNKKFLIDEEFQITGKYPNSSWNYFALAKWVDINILK